MFAVPRVTLNTESISSALFSAPSGESTFEAWSPETTYCLCENDPHQDINPPNNNAIDKAGGRPFEAAEDRRGDVGPA